MSVETLKVKLKSGADLEIWPATFKDGHNLYQVVCRELKDVDFGNDTVQKLSMTLDSSKTIEEALWPCMAKATYKGLRVTPELFENPEARCDFMEIQREVLSYNISPFTKSVASLLKVIFQKDTDIPK